MAGWRISVFLASRFEGFKHLRTELTKELVTRDMFPVNLDDGHADPRDTEARSLDELEECDAMVLLLGAGYGDPHEDGLSTTHREFRRAAATAKPVFAYASNTIDPLTPAGWFAAEAKPSSTFGKLEDHSKLDAARIVWRHHAMAATPTFRS